MQKVFARVNWSRKDPSTYGKVDMQIRDIASPDLPSGFSTTSLTDQHWCIASIIVDGVEAMCGKPACPGAHGWLCQYHYLRDTVTVDRPTVFQASEKLDNDNIQFIIEQDRLAIDFPWLEQNVAIRLGRFRGWHPYMPKDRHSLYEQADPEYVM